MDVKKQVSPMTVVASIVGLLILIALAWFFGFNRPSSSTEAPDPNQPPSMEGAPQMQRRAQ